MNIKRGDLVKLKSGGPDMTVQDLSDYSFNEDSINGALCTWFECGEIKDHVFNITSLKPVKDSKNEH